MSTNPAPSPPQPSRTTDLLTPLGTLHTPEQCRTLLGQLMDEVDWQHDYQAFGRRFQVPRLQAWYADPGVHYRYANNLLTRKDWIPRLLTLRQAVERACDQPFNAVLVTGYRHGGDHVTWHADDEPELGDAPVIASLSLGATRTLQYQPKAGGDIHALPLADGELLLMQPDFQRHWLHAVPEEPDSPGLRINLTFRRVLPRPI